MHKLKKSKNNKYLIITYPDVLKIYKKLYILYMLYDKKYLV